MTHAWRLSLMCLATTASLALALDGGFSVDGIAVGAVPAGPRAVGLARS